MEKTKLDEPVIKFISYSSLMNFKDCGYLFKLANVNKLSTFTDSYDTFFGTLLHEAVQDVLSKKRTASRAFHRLDRGWRLFHRIENKFNLSDETYQQYVDAAKQVVENIYDVFFKKFGEFEILGIEIRLEESISDAFPQKFKGFIDIVFKYGEGRIGVADFKTCGSAFMFKEYQDKHKEAQLVYYKHFLAKHLDLKPEDIDCFFVLCEKTAKTKGLPIEIVPVASGKVKTKNAMEFLETSLNSINKNIFIKNRLSCVRGGIICPFLNSEHCKTPKHFK